MSVLTTNMPDLRHALNGRGIEALRPVLRYNEAGQITANGTLREDEWKQIDEALVPIAKQRLTGIGDLMARGLVYRVPNGLGKTVLEYEDVSDIAPAQMSMDALTRGQKDRLEYSVKYLPLPIIHYDYQLSLRVLEASREKGMPLNVDMAQNAARKVAEFAENMLFNGSSDYTFGGGTIYGYCDAPNRNNVTLTKAWNDSTKTGEEILADVVKMKQASINAKHFGPWVVYIPTAYETAIDADFKAASDKTVRQRLLELGGIEDVKVSDSLAANNVVLVEMNTNTVRIVEGLPLTNVEWQTEGPFLTQYKVMTIMVPNIRADQAGNSGIVHLA
jgi:uncharacterized linocin/CFP29 family protein